MLVDHAGCDDAAARLPGKRLEERVAPDGYEVGLVDRDVS
jgi:hypothetical protein